MRMKPCQFFHLHNPSLQSSGDGEGENRMLGDGGWGVGGGGSVAIVFRQLLGLETLKSTKKLGVMR